MQRQPITTAGKTRIPTGVSAAARALLMWKRDLDAAIKAGRPSDSAHIEVATHMCRSHATWLIAGGAAPLCKAGA